MSQPRIILPAIVVDNNDTEGLARVKVQFKGFDADVDSPWVRVLWPYASNAFGSVILPEVDDEVIVLKGFGDAADQMFILGSVYNGTNMPNYSGDDGENNIKEFKTRSGHVLQYDDTDGSEKLVLHTPDQDLILEMDHAGTTINILAQGNAESGTINVVVASGTVNVECDKAVVTAETSIEASAGNSVTITGDSTVEITGSSSVTVKSDSKVDVKAPQINISGDMVAIG